MSIDRDNATPLYRQLKAVLLEKIMSGEYPADSRLPSERELCRQYHMSRMTVRNALSELLQEGWIYTRQGKGTFVGCPKLSQGLVIMGFTERMEMLGIKPSSILVDQHIQEAYGDVASRLNLPSGSPVMFLKRVRLADGVPILLEEAYISLAVAPRVVEFDFSTHSLYDVFRNYCNITLVRAEQTLEAVLARREDAELLRIDLPAALMLRNRVTYSSKGEAVEYVWGRYRGDRYKFDITLYRSPGG